MFSVNKGGTVFYRPVKNTAEVRSGYLFKSPPQKLVKTQKWKRRYFVLFKIDEQEHLLKYFKSPEEKDSPLGAIDLSQISLLYKNPAKHGRWPWVEKVLKCSASCVFLIKAAEREYFLAADNRSGGCSNQDTFFSRAEDHSKRRVSEPVYDYPKTFKTKTRAGNLTIRRKNVKYCLTESSGTKQICAMLCVRHSVSGWTCQPQPVCLFHREDRILAINDLLTTSLQEFNMYLSKCLKNEVKLTTLRLPGSQPLHSPDCPCSD
uniref:Pleckstrin homology domain containing S1, tandem duplicate 2 n=1 Tax=Gasterosteus aculeatus aculeatus TaxID=481459 RepID=A0AAQ4P3G4_GASAC